MEKYEKPEMEIIVFDNEEIRTLTGAGDIVNSTERLNSNSINQSF